MAAPVVTGDKQLDRMLTHMRTTAARRAISLGMRKAAQQLAKDVKASVPSRFKEARKQIGWRSLKVSEAPGGGAKVGRRVGRKSLRRESKFKERKGRKGVGLGRGLAWVLKGTKPRYTGKKGGPVRFTGAFPKQARTVGETARANAGKTKQILTHHIRIGIQKEVAKGKAF